MAHKIRIMHDAWEKMSMYIDNCPQEIAGLGKVEIIEGIPTVTDVAIFKQEVSSAHANIDPDALAMFQVELIRKGDTPEKWTCLWHSHAKMDAFFSGTDTGTMERAGEEQPYLISIVSNHAHKLVGRIDMFQPFRLIVDAAVELVYTQDATLKDTIKKEIAEKVTMPKPASHFPSWGASWNSPRAGFKTPQKTTVHIDDDAPPLRLPVGETTAELEMELADIEAQLPTAATRHRRALNKRAQIIKGKLQRRAYADL